MREVANTVVEAARQGSRAAIESLLRTIQPDVYGLAVRMLWHPEDARDATQEILLKVVTHLAAFRGESRFTTWAFRIASNHLRDWRTSRLEAAKLDFAALAADLDDGLDERAVDSAHDPEHQLMLEEIRIGCTFAMLACLDRSHRLAYILGEIFEMTDTEAAVALRLSPTTFRKRLSRARRALGAFMQSRCGIVNPDNPCRCAKRVSRAIVLGRADAVRPLFVSREGVSMTYADVVSQVRVLEETRRAGALMRANPSRLPETDITWLTRVIEQHAPTYASAAATRSSASD